MKTMTLEEMEAKLKASEEYAISRPIEDARPT